VTRTCTCCEHASVNDSNRASQATGSHLVDPTLQALVIRSMADLDVRLRMPLCLPTFVLSLVATAKRKQYAWVVAIVIAGLVGLAGLLGPVGRRGCSCLLTTGVTFVTPLGLVALITLVYSLRPNGRYVSGFGWPGSGRSSDLRRCRGSARMRIWLHRIF
jgi:hypothetical protein